MDIISFILNAGVNIVVPYDPQAWCEAAVAGTDGLQAWDASVGAVQCQGPGW